MAMDLEEQEQVDALKAWWKEHGNKVIVGLTVFVLTVAGWRGWEAYQSKQTGEAAALFEVLRVELATNDPKKIRDVAGQLIDKFPRTVYATDAAMIAAKINFESGDAKSAKAQYQWVIEHAKQAQSKDLAHLRLAVVLLDEKNYGDALKQLESAHDTAFAPLFNDLKGDVYALQGKSKEARSAYQAAIDKLPKDSPFKNYVQIKLDALGEQG
ncbi:MAG: tetratricopeptide repeat protein [Burkholderiales bacterium]|nr:tetratricopeptide repeat protein [Burkholderiales bacterium]